MAFDPASFTAVKVKHTGEEDPFVFAADDAAKEYLAAAATAFFGKKEANGAKELDIPSPVVLAFDPSGAKAAVSTKSGNSTGEPKKKDEFVKALVTPNPNR